MPTPSPPLRHAAALGLLLLLFPVAASAQADTSAAAPADTAASAPAAQAGPDESLQARMRAVFANIDAFDAVQVDVRDGVVRLAGTVAGAEAREKAEALAARFPDVLYVDNQIAEATDVETRVSPAIERVRGYWERTVANLPVIAVALLVLVIFGVLARFVGRWETPFERLGVSPLVHGLVRRLLSTVLFTVGLVLALDILDVTALVGAILGTAGVIGLALGFAFQDIVENYLAGVLLSVRRPFAVGDLVEVVGYQGKVIRLTAREMVMMTTEGNHLRLPNATVFKSPVVNYTRNPRRLFNFSVGIANEADLAQVMDLGRQTLQAMHGVMDDPAPFARIAELGDSNVQVRFFGWVDQRIADFAKVRSEALRLVKAAFDEAGVEMPEPIYRVNLSRLPAPAEVPPRVSPAEAPQAAPDVSVDTDLDEQIREDLAASDEQNLLTEQ